MLDLRIYRAAFVPILLVLVVVAFSLQTRPNPITTAVPPDAFDAPRAFRLLDDLADRYPDRAPGSAGDLALAGAVQRAFQATDFEVTTTDTSAETVDGERTLRTVVAARPGRVNRAIVVLAHRDAQDAPARASLSATASLMELARLLNGRATRAHDRARLHQRRQRRQRGRRRLGPAGAGAGRRRARARRHGGRDRSAARRWSGGPTRAASRRSG